MNNDDIKSSEIACDWLQGDLTEQLLPIIHVHDGGSNQYVG